MATSIRVGDGVITRAKANGILWRTKSGKVWHAVYEEGQAVWTSEGLSAILLSTSCGILLSNPINIKTSDLKGARTCRNCV